MMSNDISFEVVISDYITLRTEGDLQEEGSKIIRGSKLFGEIENLAVGQKVMFSGVLFKGETTCLRETSLTNSGSITGPDFEIKFKDVKLLQ